MTIMVAIRMACENSIGICQNISAGYCTARAITTLECHSLTTFALGGNNLKRGGIDKRARVLNCCSECGKEEEGAVRLKACKFEGV